jgi:hypothetical protein
MKQKLKIDLKVVHPYHMVLTYYIITFIKIVQNLLTLTITYLVLSLLVCLGLLLNSQALGQSPKIDIVRSLRSFSYSKFKVTWIVFEEWVYPNSNPKISTKEKTCCTCWWRLRHRKHTISPKKIHCQILKTYFAIDWLSWWS